MSTEPSVPKAKDSDNNSKTKSLSLELRLKARKSWLIAGGDITDKDKLPVESKKAADIVPFRESCVKWDKDSASISEPKPLIPGSSLRGALRHRTLFYYTLLHQQDVQEKEQRIGFVGVDLTDEQLSPFYELFGREKGEKDASVSQLFVLDSPVTYKISDITHGFQEHITLDRFTGGALSGHLFTESFFWKSEIQVRLYVEDYFLDNSTLDAFRFWVIQALERAILDLCTGLLQVGHGDARGHGRFELVDEKQLDCIKTKFKHYIDAFSSEKAEDAK